jgi:hypothetical protein
MLPWGHAAVGYLLLSGSDRLRGTRPTAASTIAVLVATQIPDLIDKPLAYTVPILPNGRSLAHSLLTGSIVLAAIVALLLLLGLGRLVFPVALGYLSHPVMDALDPAVSGEPVGYLAWPVIPPIEYADSPDSILGILLDTDPLAPMFLLQFGLVLAALAVWHRDGRPGLSLVRTWLGRRLPAASDRR